MIRNYRFLFMKLIRKIICIVLLAGLFFGWGYRRGAASVEMRDSTVTRWVPWPVPVYDTGSVSFSVSGVSLQTS